MATFCQGEGAGGEGYLPHCFERVTFDFVLTAVSVNWCWGHLYPRSVLDVNTLCCSPCESNCLCGIAMYTTYDARKLIYVARVIIYDARVVSDKPCSSMKTLWNACNFEVSTWKKDLFYPRDLQNVPSKIPLVFGAFWKFYAKTDLSAPKLT